MRQYLTPLAAPFFDGRPLPVSWRSAWTSSVKGGLNRVRRLEIASHDETTRLDLTLVWAGARPAVRVLSLDLCKQAPVRLSAESERRLHRQLGLLQDLWSQPCFSLRSEESRPLFARLTFSQAMRWLFGLTLPEQAERVDIRGWVLGLSPSLVKSFGPFAPSGRFFSWTTRAEN